MLSAKLRAFAHPSTSDPGVARPGANVVTATKATADEAALLAALKRGEDWAFETMIRLYGGRLLAVARRFTRNEDDAKDVLQSAYLNAFRAVGEFEGNCLLSTWLHRIVVNTALMKLRSRKRNCRSFAHPSFSLTVCRPAASWSISSGSV